MATTEAEASGTGRVPSPGSVYDGFISYSHAADDLLAPRLQTGLQRFAKPWWKRRALRLFRDEASLSANPHLWLSITEALDSSAWLVLLLSPEAAKSDWVNREIEYWTTRRDSQRILPVVTDGSFTWRDGEASGSAVPPALKSVFTGEPRWVDMRFVQSDEHLDLKNPAFLNAVADIASTLRGVAKDELASEEVRQHRRMIRIAWAAGAALLALAAVAVVFGIQASQQRLLAERNERLANEEAAEADRQAQIARENEDLAKEKQSEAVEQAQIADSRRLAAQSILVRETDVELSILLALQAIRTTADAAAQAEATIALRDAVESLNLLWRLPVPRRTSSAALSPDASVVYHSSAGESVLRAIDLVTGETIWEYSEPVQPGKFGQVEASPDESLVSLSVAVTDANPARVLIFDAASGKIVVSLPSEGCPRISTRPGGFSTEGRFFTMTTGTSDCGDPDDPDADWAVGYDTTTWEVALSYRADGAVEETLRVYETAERILRSRGLTVPDVPSRADFEDEHVEILSYPDAEPIAEFAVARWAASSPLGDRYIYDKILTGLSWGWRFRLLDSELSQVAELSGVEYKQGDFIPKPVCCAPIAFSPDGTLIFVATDTSDFIFDAVDGRLVMRLGPPRKTLDYSWSGDGSKLLTTHEGVLLLWATKPDTASLSEEALAEDTVALALSLLTRGMSQSECSRYEIDPCPTLEEMTRD